MCYSKRLNLQAYDLINEKIDSEGAKMLEAIAEILNDLEIRANLDFEPFKIQWINNSLIRHRWASCMDGPNVLENKRPLPRLLIAVKGTLGYLG